MRIKSFAVGLLIATVTTGVFWWQSADTVGMDSALSAAPVAAVAPATAATKAVAAGNQKESAPLAEKVIGEQERERIMLEEQAHELQRLLGEAERLGRGNVQRWLEPYWRKCKAAGAQACAKMLQDLAPFLTPQQMKWLASALENFGTYHDEMSGLTMSTRTQTPRQRYEAIKQLRLKHFGAQSDALFGRQDQFAEYQFSYDYLRSVEASQLGAEQRLAALEKLRQPLQLGEDQRDLLGPDASYRQAVDLLQDLPQEQQDQWRDKLRQQYFGEKAEEVAVYEERQAEQKKQQQNYQQALGELQKRWAAKGGVNSQGYQQELEVLRRESFPPPR